MSITDEAMPVDDGNEGHASQFENFDLLPVLVGRHMIRIGQTDKRYFFSLPILPKHLVFFRTYSQDLCPSSPELIIIITQARQLRAAVGSAETT